MKVILKADVKGSGKKGDIIEVSDGFAQNFLLKKGLAEIATASGINEITQRKAADQFHKAEELKAMKELAAALNGKTVEVGIKTGENGKVFGSVTSASVAAALEKEGFQIDKKKIQMAAVKTTGIFDAEIRLMESVSAKIKVRVAAI
ncbi:MAG TPA: 50S ribosomal protein L9 [Candidatus Scatosoma pullistercoris]|uniref:Large ribosomal subunit protein bL9 n=1 Tax=Candidatus Scatosoma pullistercoris TaxID=2840934 RepID=A0A9D1SGB2_9FIRM|nr:50S ribosomal protein L9 [Candidatus Scatosoma pullistercoris]